MYEFPETRDSLIVQVKDPSNREAWDQFAQIYRPVVVRIAMRRGMQEADAHDLAQQVLWAVAQAVGRWKKNDASVKFRHWLSRITKNAILNALTRRRQDRATGGSSAQVSLESVTSRDAPIEELLAIEWRREIYWRAAKVVRDEVALATWQAFELTVLEKVPIEKAARQLGKSTGAVYSARSRVMYRLREVVRLLEIES